MIEKKSVNCNLPWISLSSLSYESFTLLNVASKQQQLRVWKLFIFFFQHAYKISYDWAHFIAISVNVLDYFQQTWIFNKKRKKERKREIERWSGFRVARLKTCMTIFWSAGTGQLCKMRTWRYPSKFSKTLSKLTIRQP